LKTKKVSNDIEIREFFKPKPKDPVLICGLPGSGYVGKLGADYLINIFKAKKMIEYYSSTFPPQVNVTEDGLVQIMKAELYHGETQQKNDLLIFTADAQPTTSKGEYELSEVVLMLAKAYGVKTVYSLAAYITGGFSKDSRVFGTATDRSMLDTLSQHGVQIMKEGGITGMNGIILGIATLHKMEGVCLLGETSGYLVDAGASQSVLEALSRLLNLNIDLTSLKERVQETQKLIAQMQRITTQPKEMSVEEKVERRPGYIS
jgi:uncharacterized protein (TIGR00162 family)